ncbi:MAG TPA: sigma-70 family RNA polymerase sigma factor [Polyangiales bacterium]|nr:sigma-70 family RNA polymerase sigma factor [Polyangiales bacterium]
MDASLRIDAGLVRELGPLLVALARRSPIQGEDAEDLVQDTWLSALTSSASFEGRSSVRTWLSTILRRRVVDKIRRARVSTPYEDDVHSQQDATDPVESRELVERALAMLSELGDAEREALALCAIGELDRGEACEELGISPGSLRVRLHRARRKLLRRAQSA